MHQTSDSELQQWSDGTGAALSNQLATRGIMSYSNPISELIDDRTHGLLEPASVAFSSVTVRRAFVVWMYCGQRNRFKDVCNYFHHLEALEEKLTAEGRASSRHHEFDLFTNQPPTSAYLTHNFPQLYTDSQLQQHIAKVESCRHDIVFKLQEFDKIVRRNGTSRHEIVDASIMIRSYCKSHTKTLATFLMEFKEHTERCGLTNTVGNVAFYIKRKIIQAEIELEANYAITLELLTKHDAVGDAVEEVSNIQVQCSADRTKPVILKESNSLNSVSSRPLSDKKCVKNKMSDLSSINEDHLRWKCQHFSKNNTGKENTPKTVDPADNTIDCEDMGIAKFRSRRFSGSNFIKKDTLKLRKI